jgi:hypothetical protein
MFTTKNLFKLVGKHLLVAVCFLLLAIVSVVILSGQITKVSERTAKERHLSTTLGERTELLTNLKRETDFIGTNDVIIKNSFIPSNNILEFVAILESIALKNGVTQTFHFSSPTLGALGSLPITTLSYQNTISANAPTFINYLRDFETLPYFTKIDSITISSGSADWRSASSISISASVVASAAE